MNNIRKNMRVMLTIFILMFVALIGFTIYSVTVYGEKWFSSPYNTRVIEQKNNIIPGDITDRNGVAIATSDGNKERTYSTDASTRKSLAHFLGDPYGIVSGGIESTQAKYIYGFNIDMFERVYQAFMSQESKGNNVKTTIDSKLNKFIYDTMGSQNGAVVVMNYKTGEILGSVSKPTYEPKDVKELAKNAKPDDKSAIFLNRATLGKYTPGSVFKLITTVAAIENVPNVETKKYNSPASLAYGSDTVTNFGKVSHGEVNLKKAFEVSSNTVFAQLAEEIGKENMKKTAEKFGFNDNFLFSEVAIANSSYKPGNSPVDFAWSVNGQFEDIVTPIHMNMITASIANGGTMMVPKTVLQATDLLGKSVQTFKPEEYKRVTSATTAQIVKEYMVNAVKNGTGKTAQVSGLTIGGKTGTAQVGQGKEDHAWFTGFIDDPITPYAVTVVLENSGGTGGTNAAPMAQKVFNFMVK